MLNNKSILITGGTGSLGKACVTHLLEYYKPKKIVIFSRDELMQYNMSQIFDSDCLEFVVGDVKDFSSLNNAFRGIDLVIHAAALKHVPIAEKNPRECIKTNILGAMNVIDSAINNDVQKVIALSTDKAALPVNLYGATKLASDKLFIDANQSSEDTTQFSLVRYGNVIGSRGSVIPYFNQLIKMGNTKLPITHMDMTRLWITLKHCSKFVVDAFDKMIGGEILIPKIHSARIIDIAKALDSQAEFEVIGMRPGEKLHEVLISDYDAPHTIEFNDYFSIAPIVAKSLKDLYVINGQGLSGQLVNKDFVYASNINSTMLSINELKNIIKEAFT